MTDERACLDCPAILPRGKGRPRLRCPDCAAKRHLANLEAWKQKFRDRHKGKRCPTCGHLLKTHDI